jgi:hypothetical protein
MQKIGMVWFIITCVLSVAGMAFFGLSFSLMTIAVSCFFLLFLSLLEGFPEGFWVFAALLLFVVAGIATFL